MAKRKQRKRPSPGAQYGLLWLPVVLFFSLLAGLAVFYVWERIEMGKINREIIELQLSIQEVKNENARLLAQAEELSSYRRINQIARRHFGFVQLKPQIVFMAEKSGAR